MVQYSDGEWRAHMFCVGGLYGKNLSFKIGTKKNNCDFPAANSYSNMTCEDNKSMAILVSDNCTALITRYINSTVHLEREREKPVLPSSFETFGDQKNAIKYVLSKITPNPNSTGTPNSVGTTNPNAVGRKQNDKIPETGDNNNLWPIVASLVVVAAVVVVIAGGRFIQWCKNKRRSSEISSPEEGVALNAVQVTDGTPNGINGHAAHYGISSESPVVGSEKKINDARQL